MPTNYLSPVFNEQTFDASGSPLVGGKIETYVAGTSTPLATYTTQSGTTQQANPIILNARGEPANPIWLGAGQLYKFILKDSGGSLIRTIDNVGGVNDTSISVSDWVSSGFTPTYISAVSFSVQGDKTTDFAAGRRVRSTNSGGTVYSTVATSSYSSGTGLTTVTVRNDSGTIDAGLSAVDVGILTPVNPSVPNSQAVRQALGLGWGTDIASAATLDLTARTGNIVRITGTTTTTAVTLANGDQVWCYAVAAWPLTYNATTMPLPGGKDYTCVAGDIVVFTKDGNGTISVRISNKNTLLSDIGVRFSTGNVVGVASSIPTSGSYTAGDIVFEISSSVVGLSGWKRLTTGSSHVLGTDWKYFGGAVSMVRLNTANGYGSTNTKIRRFTNVVTNQGADITYADSATLGGSFTINTAGVYSLSYSDSVSSAEHICLSLNTANPTTNPASLPVGEVLSISIISTTGGFAGNVCWTGYLAAGAVVRAHSDGVAASGPAAQFTITRVA